MFSPLYTIPRRHATKNPAGRVRGGLRGAFSGCRPRWRWTGRRPSPRRNGQGLCQSVRLRCTSAPTRRGSRLCRAESRGKRYGVNRESFSVHCITESQYFCQAHNICSKLSCWDAVYNEWENASVIAKMAKDPTAILDDVTRRKEMLEIELQCSNYYLDMSDGVQHPVPKPDYTENTPESFLSSLLKKKED